MYRRFSKLIKDACYYPRLLDKCLSLYNVLLVSSKLRHFPLPGRFRSISILLRGFPHPFFVRLGTTDWLVLVEIFIDGEYSTVPSQFDTGNPITIIDLGSNVGFSVIYWLYKFPNARIIAVEPDTDNCEMIKRNCASMAQTNAVTIVKACVLAHPRETAYLDTSSGREWAYSVTANEHAIGQKVRAVTLAQLICEYSVQLPIDLLKCDIEGSEKELFEHAHEWIKQVRLAVVEVHGDYTVKDLQHQLVGHGLKPARHTASSDSLGVFSLRV